jgi:hypothetical protein
VRATLDSKLDNLNSQNRLSSLQMVDRMLSFNSESPSPNKREEKEELKKEQEMIKSAKDQWEAIKNDPKKLFPQSTSASILKA